MLESFACSLTFLQVCCQSALLYNFASKEVRQQLSDWERRSRHRAACDFLFCPGPAAEVIGRIGAQIGQGCFGKVYALYRDGQKVAVKVPRCDGPTPEQNGSILREEHHRAASLRHPNLVEALGSFGATGAVTLWQFVEGLPWPAAVPALRPAARCEVALQLASVTQYVSGKNFLMWDLHPDDLVIEARAGGPHIVLLDVFMAPSENSGCLLTLPPELKAGGPQRMPLGKHSWHRYDAMM
eukprot:s2172_g7.t1